MLLSDTSNLGLMTPHLFKRPFNMTTIYRNVRYHTSHNVCANKRFFLYLARPMVVDKLELANIPVLHHDRQKFNNHFAAWSNQNLTFTTPLCATTHTHTHTHTRHHTAQRTHSVTKKRNLKSEQRTQHVHAPPHHENGNAAITTNNKTTPHNNTTPSTNLR